MKIFLAVPKMKDEIHELKKFLSEFNSDIYIFPEGFLRYENLDEALSIIKNKFVITGFRSHDKYEKALVIEEGKIIGEYSKCILTKDEYTKGKKEGDAIHTIETKYGIIGIPICYEIHFPEVSRVMMYDNPVLLINLIGKGMYHSKQLYQWTNICKARAIENEVFLIGCSHFCGEIPLAFAYSPEGNVITEYINQYGGVIIDIDLAQSQNKKIGYFLDRKPHLFKKISL
ncbi:MAG: carbon-nitrogen hydrolase family protein [Clostridia bacterium]|nr:carbon-nitrogen hydrolase family protein [Clostridia bacterium]